MNGFVEEIERQIVSSPASRARLLADTLEILEKQGVDAGSEGFRGLVAADISNEEAFRGALAASTVVIVIGSAGQRGAGTLGRLGNVASTVVIAIASAGQRGAGSFGGLGTAASTVVIAIASAGQRGAGRFGGLGTAASTVVIAIASAGQRGAGRFGGLGTAASTVVIAIASAGQRGAGMTGRVESTAGGSATANLPSIDNLVDVSGALRQLADLVDARQVEITQEVGVAFQQLVDQLGGGQ